MGERKYANPEGCYDVIEKLLTKDKYENPEMLLLYCVHKYNRLQFLELDIKNRNLLFKSIEFCNKNKATILIKCDAKKS